MIKQKSYESDFKFQSDSINTSGHCSGSDRSWLNFKFQSDSINTAEMTGIGQQILTFKFQSDSINTAKVMIKADGVTTLNSNLILLILRRLIIQQVQYVLFKFQSDSINTGGTYEAYTAAEKIFKFQSDSINTRPVCYDSFVVFYL